MALACGFADQSHVKRVFSHHGGDTPAARRRQKSVLSTLATGLWLRYWCRASQRTENHLAQQNAEVQSRRTLQDHALPKFIVLEM
jgi:AraC-like DNA-binding protein